MQAFSEWREGPRDSCSAFLELCVLQPEEKKQ